MNKHITTLGEIIRKKRKEKKWTLQRLSEVSGLSTSYISMLERNLKSAPSIEALNKIAKCLNFSKKELLEAVNFSDKELLEAVIFPKKTEHVVAFDVSGLSVEDIELIIFQINYLKERAKKRQLEMKYDN